MLKLVVRFGFLSDIVYIAMYYYKTNRYKEALFVIEIAKVKLSQPHIMYCGNMKPDNYTKAVDGLSFSAKNETCRSRRYQTQQ